MFANWSRASLVLGALALAPLTAGAHAHGPVPPSPGERRAAAYGEPGSPASTVPVTVDLPDTWGCGIRTQDDVVHALSAGPVYKVVYAYTTDRGNRFGEWATTIQRMVERSMNMVANPARDGSRAPGRTVRFDLGTACDPLEADIQAVALPRAASEYPADWPALMDALVADLKPAVGSAGQRNVVAVIDGVSHPAVWGIGHFAADDIPGDTNAAHGGGRYSVVLPSDGLDPSTPEDPFGWGAYADPIDLAAEVMTHEILHNLGAVSSQSPAYNGRDVHSKLRGDIMFSGGQDSPQCPAHEARYHEIDCLGDSYFNPSPAPGSWVAAHWNVVNSVHLCALEECTARSRPPAIAVEAPAGVEAGETATLTASASDADGHAIAAIAWDLDGDAEQEATGPSASVTFSEPGFHRVAARVTDSSGEFGIGQALVYVWPPRAEAAPATSAPTSTTPTGDLGSPLTPPTDTTDTADTFKIRVRAFPSKVRLGSLRRAGLAFSGTASSGGPVRIVLGTGRRLLASKRIRVEPGSFRGRLRLSRSALRNLRRLPRTVTVMIGPESGRTRPTVARIRVVR